MGFDGFFPMTGVTGSHKVRQGELHPFILKSGGIMMDQEVDRIMTDMMSMPHVFNLSHGIDQHTPTDHVQNVIDRVRAWDEGRLGYVNLKVRG
jgi:uroporphyrinogen decarboxylase